MLDFLKEHIWIFRSVILVLSFIVGFLVDKILVTALAKWAKKSKWLWDDLFAKSLRWIPTLSLTLFGAYGAFLFIKPQPKWMGLVHNGFEAIGIFILTILGARFLSGAIEVLTKQTGGMFQKTTLFSRTTNLVVYLFGFFIILQNLNIKITPLLTALGVGGLAVALGLQDILGNLFAGIQILATRQVRIGDYVELENGKQGYVTDIKGRNTTICSYPDSNMIIVPNTRLAGTVVTNYNLPRKQMALVFDVGVSYASDLQHVEDVTLDVANQIHTSVLGGRTDEEPVVRFYKFDDFSINFRVRLYINEFRDKYLMQHEFIKALHKRYKAEGIEIPFPIRTLHVPEEFKIKQTAS